MTFGSLFAGIGGLDLGLERAGLTCKWQVEINEYARRILARHWPNVRRWDDVTTFLADTTYDITQDGRQADALEKSGDWNVDLICGGFPCQDISYAGKGAGLDGKRSGLFYELMRIVRVLGPRYVLLENVAALLTRGIDAVLGSLAACGYDAEWTCIPAAALGAPHIRERVFILAHAKRERLFVRGANEQISRECSDSGGGYWHGRREKETNKQEVGNLDGSRLQERACFGSYARKELAAASQTNRGNGGIWHAEPDVVRVANGVPSRVDRIRGLGNSVVPQVGEFLGRCILEFDK